MEAAIREFAGLLRNARRILFITGAGISADSGLPTYRGVGGLYEDGLTVEGLSIEEALSGPMFRARPDLTWKYLAQIERACRGALPNAAHLGIAALESGREQVAVLTQNVDGLHEAAGSRDVIEIHGNLRHLQCTRCGTTQQVEDYAALTIPPACGRCGGMVRPQVVLFGESLPGSALRRLRDALQAGPDLVCTIGTSSVFPYIVEPVWWARQVGIPTVEINPGESEVSAVVQLRLPMGAAEAFTRLADYGWV